MAPNKIGHEPYYGLKKVVPAEGVTDNTTVDIIAIHGLETESPRTWTYNREGGQAVNWLEDTDMLQAAVPQARIYTYNWNAKVFDDAPVQALLGHADTLLNLVMGEQGRNRRPIVFIASCFGGLILAQAMNRAGQKDNPYQHVLLHTAGIVFLATPFRGSNAAKPANWCVVVGGIMGNQTSEQLVENLNREDKELRKLTQEFAELIFKDSFRLPVHCFYETSKTKVLRRWFSRKLVNILRPFLNNQAEVLIVAEDSACLDGVRRHRLDGDHSMTHKFDGPKNANYQHVKNVIEDLVSNAPTFVERDNVIQGPFIYHSTLEEIRQNGMHTRLQVDRIDAAISRLEASSRVEESPSTALIGEISNGLQRYARRRSEISYADSHAGFSLNPVNSTFEIDIPNQTARFSCPTSPSFRRITDGSSGPTRRLGRLRCQCKVGRSLKVWNYGPLGFKIENQLAQQCPLHKRSSTNYTIEARLTPWINKRLEFALLLGSGKIWEISPSLRFRATVKRSESPMFQLFDRVLDQCLTIDYSTTFKAPWQVVGIATRLESRGGYYRATWDEKKIIQKFDELVRGVMEVIIAGKASGDDSDENGSTLLIEISYLITMMQQHFFLVVPQMGQLLQLALDCRVDPMATAKFGSSTYMWCMSNDIQPMTAMSYYYHNTMKLRAYSGVKRFIMNHNQIVSLFQVLKPYEGIIESIGQPCHKYRHFESCCFEMLKAFVADPELAETCGYSGIHLAVIRRSLSKLKSYFPSDWTDSILPKSPGLTQFDPMELALGWTEGLQFLVDQGCHIGRAFYMARYLCDYESVSILLSSRNDIFSLNYNKRLGWKQVDSAIIEIALYDEETWYLAANELWQRRNELIRFLTNTFNLDSQYLGDILESVKITNSLHDQLIDKATNLPNRLKYLDSRSPYGLLIRYKRFNLDHYNILYDIGFVNLQELCEDGIPPLAELCYYYFTEFYKSTVPDPSVWFKIASWFVERGADPDFSPYLRWPHLQFYAALATYFGGQENSGVFGICKSTLITDFCECACSSKGCIPPFLLWSCSPINSTRHDECGYHFPFRERKLQYWLQMCGFKRHEIESSYEELCRRELFDRLGMRHTCCSVLGFQSAEEKRTLWSEDASAKSELLWLVGIYKTVRRQLQDVTMTRFWSLWWMIADCVILPLLPGEACRYPWWTKHEDWYQWYSSGKKIGELRQQIRQKRLDRWQDLRSKAGYEELEDKQMFQFHFTRFWLLAKAHRQRLVSWKRHRLMARPKFILT